LVAAGLAALEAFRAALAGKPFVPKKHYVYILLFFLRDPVRFIRGTMLASGTFISVGRNWSERRPIVVRTLRQRRTAFQSPSAARSVL